MLQYDRNTSIYQISWNLLVPHNSYFNCQINPKRSDNWEISDTKTKFRTVCFSGGVGWGILYCSNPLGGVYKLADFDTLPINILLIADGR